MRLSTVDLTALHLTVALAAILLFSSNTLAQHSAGGGGSSGGGSASSGGGGSHGGSSGGSVSSSSVSSAGHSSSGSASHSSSSHTAASALASHSGVHGTQPNTSHSVHEPNASLQGKTEPSQKRGLFSFLRHPFRKPLPPETTNEPAASLRRPVCFRGPCAVCPKGGCGGAVIANNIVRHPCPAGEFRSGGGCRPQAFLDDCNGLQMMVERQAQRMQEAQAARPSACSADPQQCSASSSSAESEASLYRELQERYQACQRKAPTAFPYSTSLSFNAVR
jgi:hypothetical protein